MNLAEIPKPWLLCLLSFLIGMIFDQASADGRGGRKTVYALFAAAGFVASFFFLYVWIAL